MDSRPSFCPEYFPSGSAFIVHPNLGRIQAVLLTLPMKYYFYRQRSTTSVAYAVLLLFFPFPFCPHRMKRKVSGKSAEIIWEDLSAVVSKHITCSSSQADAFSYDEASGPGGLEIEATGDGIYIQNFTSEVEAGTELAFQGVGVDVLERDAAAGDELFLVGASARDAVTVVGECLHQSVHALLAHFCPFPFGRYAGSLCQVLPQAGG